MAGSRAALDVLLTDAAVSRGGARRFLEPAAAREGAGRTRPAPRPGARPGRGRSGLSSGRSPPGAPSARRPRRSPLHRPRLEAELAVAAVAAVLPRRRRRGRGLIDDAGSTGGPSARRGSRLGNVLDALAPSNFPWSNPTVIKQTVDDGGANLVKGARRFVRDVSRAPRLPATVDTEQVRGRRQPRAQPGLGRAANEAFELIQYQPTTEQVREVPLLFVPADDQPLLRARPGPGPEHGRAPARTRASRCS